MDARKRYKCRLTMQKIDLPGEKRVRLKKTLFCKAFAPPIICTNLSSWIRVFEVGAVCVANTEAIEGIFKRVENLSEHLKKTYQERGNSRFGCWVLDQFQRTIKAHAELYEVWMHTNTWACILCPGIMFSDKLLLHAHTVLKHASPWQ